MLIRRLIGTIYILGILILAFDVLFYIFQGFLPSVLLDYFASGLALVHKCSDYLSIPVAFVLDFAVSHIPFIGSFVPVLKTEIFNAEIHWAPLFSLFIYSGILKWFDEVILKSKVNKIENNYKKNQQAAPHGFNVEE
jgi:hypothetical protein